MGDLLYSGWLADCSLTQKSVGNSSVAFAPVLKKYAKKLGTAGNRHESARQC